MKIYKSYINTSNANSTGELNSMDYDLELINLIGNQDTTAHESDTENNHSLDESASVRHGDEASAVTSLVKDELNEYDDDDDFEYVEYEEETINKKRKLIAKKSKQQQQQQQAKIVKVVIGTRSASKRYNLEENSEDELLKRGEPKSRCD